MNHELLAILEYIEQERGVSKDQLVDAVEKALLTASRKSIHPASELEVKVDKHTGDIRAWATLTVVDADPNDDQILLKDAQAVSPGVQLGEKVRVEVTPRNFGRIAAQTAKQAILQQIRKAEKDTVVEEFKDKVGELVNGTVRRYEQGNIIVDLQKAEGVIGNRDRVPGEQYMPGDRINALLVKVNTTEPGPCLVLSRASAAFMRKLFEREVSEIHDGVVEIVAIAREAGSRTKLAVRSADPRIDPVGACVGMRGMRVKNITNELNGERVDIIPFSDEPAKYIANALHPAKAEKIEVDEANHTVTFFVDEENSRLAFGKKAQNVRLAQKLTQWKIELKQMDDADRANVAFLKEKAARTQTLASVLGVPVQTAELLVSNGFLTVEGLSVLPEAELRAMEGLSEEDASIILAKIAQAKSSQAE